VSTADARAALARPLPYVLALMVFIVVCQFNSIRSTLLIWLIMPLAIIGVKAGLLLTGKPFGFMALLGVLSLGGELIKMQIVVLSKILTEIDKGKAPYQAILDGGVSKSRPVFMVVFTTVLGMIPLLKDPFFGAMAACIMFGLSFAGILCLLVTPVMYAIFFGIREPAAVSAGAQPMGPGEVKAAHLSQYEQDGWGTFRPAMMPTIRTRQSSSPGPDQSLHRIQYVLPSAARTTRRRRLSMLSGCSNWR
jgi:hypothetical protein